ncbi:MAG: flippase [Candidatus Omnitrophica bacterium]|nr:flippase [Candidatus Omnitrophota bacterium]
MMRKTKRIQPLSREKRILMGNFLSLSVLEVANYVLPLLTLPYLVRVLGPEKFGLIAFALAFVHYFVIFTDYGFNLSATREIAIHRKDARRVSGIFNAVLFVKVTLTAVSFLVLAAVILLVGRFNSEAIVYLFSFGVVIGNALFPVWFFQGIERMKYITVLNVVGKIIFTVAIFIFVRAESDYRLVPLITSLGYLTTGITGFLFACRRFNLHIFIPSTASVIEQLRQGWHVFISTAAISLYTTSNIVILGVFANNTVVGYYAAAEKIIRVLQRLFLPVSQAVYPHVSKLAHQSREQALRFLSRLLSLTALSTFALSCVFFLAVPLVVRTALGARYVESAGVLRILAFLPFITALSNVFGIQTMLVFNMKSAFSRILISAGVVNVVLAFMLAPRLEHTGIAVSVIVTESFVTAAMAVFLIRHGFFKFGMLTGSIGREVLS